MKFKDYCLEDLTINYDKKRKPLSSLAREKMEKKYPYYGANGIIDYVENYIYDGEYILIAEDGTVLEKDKYPVLHLTEGKFWVSNHAHVVKANEELITQEFLYYALKNTIISDKITGAVQLKLNQDNMNSIIISVPEKDDQVKIAMILKEIDNKIKLNNKINDNLLEQVA